MSFFDEICSVKFLHWISGKVISSYENNNENIHLRPELQQLLTTGEQSLAIIFFYELVHSKLRNRLGNETAPKLVFIYNHTSLKVK